MSAWWETPYPGAPPPDGLPPLPRPLYPPSAKRHGKQPSSKGPDIQAVKRAVARLGRWPWQQYDQGYWDPFALGDPSSELARSGMAGYQRQMRIDDTGWMGRKTYNALAYSLIPAGLPHAGEPAFDQVAVELLAEAWALFGGHEPDPQDDTIRQAALVRATGELGYVERDDGGSKYADWYGAGMQGGPWCAMFCTWAFETNPEGQSPSFTKGKTYAYVPYVVGDARANRNGLSTIDDPVAGDLVAYDWNWNGEYDHIGVFEAWQDDGQFTAIEGNTSTSNQSNGGQVMRRSRHRGAQGTVFVRVAEP
jgi:hypothetical protein